jgi:hypothetical protein
MFSRKKIGEAAQEIVDHLQLVDNVAALQKGQKELADAIATLSDRMRQLEADLKVIKIETKYEAVKETQLIVNAVQGALNDKLTHVAIQVDRLQHRGIGSQQTFPTLPKQGDGENPLA